MVRPAKHHSGNNTKASYPPHNENPYPEVSTIFSGAAASMVMLLPLSFLFFVEGGAVGVILLLGVALIGAICGIYLFTRPTKQTETGIPKEFAQISRAEEEYGVEEYRKAA